MTCEKCVTYNLECDTHVMTAPWIHQYMWSDVMRTDTRIALHYPPWIHVHHPGFFYGSTCRIIIQLDDARDPAKKESTESNTETALLIKPSGTHPYGWAPKPEDSPVMWNGVCTQGQYCARWLTCSSRNSYMSVGTVWDAQETVLVFLHVHLGLASERKRTFNPRRDVVWNILRKNGHL